MQRICCLVVGLMLATGTVGFAQSNCITVNGITRCSAPWQIYDSSARQVSVPVLDLTQVWNSLATTFTGLKLNVTDTGSAAASLLMDLQVAGTSKFSVTKGGGILVGTGGASGTLGGTLFTSTTATSTTGLVEETLLSYTLPANTLAVNGRGVRITAFGTTAANANSKTIKLYFGSTVLVSAANALSGGAWRTTATVLRTAATAQAADADLVFGGWAGAAQTTSTPAETLSGAVLIKVTGTTPTTIGDLTALGIVVEAI